MSDDHLRPSCDYGETAHDHADHAHLHESDAAGRAHMRASRREFIKGVIASGVAVSAAGYVVVGRGGAALPQAAGAVERLVTLNVNGRTAGRRAAERNPDPHHPLQARPHRHQAGLRSFRMRRLHGDARRCRDLFLLDADPQRARAQDHHHRRHRRSERRAAQGAEGHDRGAGTAMRLLHLRARWSRRWRCSSTIPNRRSTKRAAACPAISAGAAPTTTISKPSCAHRGRPEHGIQADRQRISRPSTSMAKVTGRAKYAEDFRADNMVFCKTLTSPIPHAKIRSIDTSAALKMPGVLGILTADDVPQFPPPQPPILAKDEVFYVGEPILAVAAESEEIAARGDRGDQDRFPAAAACGRSAGKPVPGRPQCALRRQCRGRPDQAADRQMGRAPISPPPATTSCRWASPARGMELWRCRCRLQGRQGDRSRRASSPAPIRTTAWRPRTTFAYWQGGKCFLHGSNQSHTAAIANIARYIGIQPEDLVFIAEYCGGGFGSKIPGYPNMAIAALAVEEDQPAGDASHLPQRGIWHRQRAARLPGPHQDGLPRRRQAARRRPLHRAGERPAYPRRATSAPPAMRSRWSISRRRCASARVPVLTNTVAGRRRSAVPGENQFVAVIEPMIDKAARAARHRPDRHPQASMRRTPTARSARTAARSPAPS